MWAEGNSYRVLNTVAVLHEVLHEVERLTTDIVAAWPSAEVMSEGHSAGFMQGLPVCVSANVLIIILDTRT